MELLTFGPISTLDAKQVRLRYMASHPAIQDIAKTHAMTLAAHVPWAGAMTWSKFQELVRDYAPFDIKRNIEREFQGGPIKLGEYWYEYSTPGNIAYGFYGAAAGYDLPLLHAGAGAAQLKDAYIDRDGPAGPWNYYGDTPDDYYAIEFGYYLYRALSPRPKSKSAGVCRCLR